MMKTLTPSVVRDDRRRPRRLAQRRLTRAGAIFMHFAAAVAVLASTPAAGAASKIASVKTEIVRLIARADAWGGLCVNWALDQEAAHALLSHYRVAIRGDYRAVYGFAYARAHAEAMAYHNSPNACDHALDLYGPWGHEWPSLLRPIWHPLWPPI